MLLYINKGNLTIDVYDETTQILTHSISVSASSLNIANTLFKDANKIHCRETLISSGWPNKPIGTNSLNVSIMKLRRKLATINSQIEIKSHSNLGYKLVLPAGVNLMKTQSRTVNNHSTSLKFGEKKLQTKSRSSLISLRSIRWGDLFISSLILVYSFALYHSLYRL